MFKRGNATKYTFLNEIHIFIRAILSLIKKLFRSADCPCVDDRRFLWLSYPCGTRCLREYDVFLKESIANATWKFYGEQLPGDPILAYFVETKKVQDAMLIGDVYELDYSTHFKHVEECSVSAEKYQLLVCQLLRP